jgi:hypothetical protein
MDGSKMGFDLLVSGFVKVKIELDKDDYFYLYYLNYELSESLDQFYFNDVFYFLEHNQYSDLANKHQI